MAPRPNISRYLLITGGAAVLGALCVVLVIYLLASLYKDDDIVMAKQCTDTDTAASMDRLEEGAVIKEDFSQTPVTEEMCGEINDRALLVGTNPVARAIEVERVVQEFRIIQDSMRAADENQLASRPTDSPPLDKDLPAGSPLSYVEISLLSFSQGPASTPAPAPAPTLVPAPTPAPAPAPAPTPDPANQNNYTDTLSKEKTPTVDSTSESALYEVSDNSASDSGDIHSYSQTVSPAEQQGGGPRDVGGDSPGDGGGDGPRDGGNTTTGALSSPSEQHQAKTLTTSSARDENQSAEKPIDSPATPAISSDAREAVKAGASPKEAVVEAQVAGENAGASKAAATAGAKNAVSLALIDGTLTDSVVKGSVAYNTPPKEMRWKDSTDMELVLRPSTYNAIDGLEQKIKEVKEAGELKVEPVDVSQRMEAVVFSSPEAAFDVSSITGESQQPITSAGDTDWRWKIVASNTGDNDLYLRMGIGLSSPRGESLGFRPVEGFPVSFEKISVKGTPWQNASNFVGSNWQWLWTAILVPLVALLWGRGKQSNKS